jgi:regulation of enolase protein 1 (concanavalin A-like superfamily)
MAAVELGLFQDHKDIGVTPKKGKAVYDPVNATYHVTGGGANMWLQADAFQYVYRQVSGNLALAADVDFVGKGTEAHRKAALMVRQDLTPGSPYVDVALHGDGLTALQYRTAPGATTEELRSDVKGPVRIRIERHGNEFTISAGNPGQDMKSTGPVSVGMHDPVYVGLAVCSHNAQVLETAVFSNVVLEVQKPQATK